MPKLDLPGIAPVTDASTARLVSPAAFADLATQIAATEVPAAAPRAARPGPARKRMFLARLGNSHPRRRLALLTAFPVALAAVAALLVTVLSPGAGSSGGAGGGGGAGNGANSQAAIEALSFTKADGYITVIIRNFAADPSWFNADFARHHLPYTVNVVPVSPSLVGTVIEENYAPGVRLITGPRKCFAESTGELAPCLIGFKVPENLRDAGSITIGAPTPPGQRYEGIGSIFAPGEDLAGLLKQVAGQPMSQVRPILASHHLKVVEAESQPKAGARFTVVNPASVPGNYFVTRIEPVAAGQARIYVSARRFWWGVERIKLSGSTAPTKTPTDGGSTRVTPGLGTSAPSVKPTPTTSSAP
ncbi:MAG: hypothetical protein ACRDNO_34155 [Trebonia sp.]